MNVERVLAVICLVAVVGASSARDVHADRFRPDGRYAPGVPTPASVLGFEPGDRPARYEAAVRYAEALAAASPNVRLQRYARSHEGRDLFFLVVSSEANLARLDAIRGDLARLADPRPALPPATEAGLIERTPVVAYLAYAIHGDELSSTDAALRVAYELAAGENEDTKALRENLVVLIDPMENPDGRERMLSMTTAYEGGVPNPDPDALSHSGFWPWGRGNHYLFDLNRDWFPLVQPESRGRAGILRTWRPQLTVDSHEMGSESTYLFSPPRDPFNPNLPSRVREWSERFAADQARAFDRHGWSYFTREWNEEVYPGYGSSIAMYQGAVGVLYEQAGTDGQPIRTPSGRVLSYEEAVAHQYTSSLANLTTAATHRRELLRAWRAARAEAVERGAHGPRAFYIVPRPDPARAERLATRLALLGVEVERLEAPGALTGAHSLWDDGAHAARLPAGTYRVRLDQPDGLLVRAVLEPHTPVPDSSLAQEREHLERQKDSRTYDVTAWSPLLASGLEAWWTAALDGLRWTRVEPAGTPAPPAGGIGAGPATYGWVFDGGTDAALALSARLAAAGLAVRAGEKPLRLGASELPRGSFLLRAEENPPAAAETLQSLAARAGVAVIPVSGARVPGGPDLGGDYWHLLQPARIAILAGASLDFNSVGWAWDLLDREWALRASLLDVGRVAGTDLARYNVLVMPNNRGGVEAWRRALGAGGVRAIRSWVQDGGTLIALDGAAEFVADDSTRLSAVRLRSAALKDFPPAQLGLADGAVRSLERMQGMGLGPNARAVTSWGSYEELDRGRALGIPGPGSPLLGPGARAWLGLRGAPSVTPVPAARDSASRDAKGPSEEERQKALAKADARLRRFMPQGAILRVDLDPEQWLAYGCGARAAVMSGSDDALLARDPAVTAARFAAPEVLHLGGLLWPEAAGRLAQTAYLTRESSGRGQVILFAGDPNFRGYFWGTERLFLNAALLGPGLGTAHTIPW